MLIECLLMSSQCQLKKKIINTQFKIPRDEEQMQTGAAVVAKSIVNESESTLLDKLWGDTISKWPQTFFLIMLGTETLCDTLRNQSGSPWNDCKQQEIKMNFIHVITRS